MPLGRFTVLTALGSLIWNLVLMGAGWWLGDRYGATASVSHWINVAVLVGGVGFVAWFLLRKMRSRNSPDSKPVGRHI